MLDSLTEQVLPPLSSAGVQTFTRSCPGELRRTGDSHKEEVRTVANKTFHPFRRLVHVIKCHTGGRMDFVAFGTAKEVQMWEAGAVQRFTSAHMGSAGTRPRRWALRSHQWAREWARALSNTPHSDDAVRAIRWWARIKLRRQSEICLDAMSKKNPCTLMSGQLLSGRHELLFCKFGRQMISGNCGKWLCRTCQMECKDFNVLRDIFRTYSGIWARGCRGKPSRCVCSRPAGPICCADQHLDVSVGCRRTPEFGRFYFNFILCV